MKDNIRYLVINCLLLVWAAASAKAQAPADSGKVFSLQHLQQYVLYHHPVVKQAALLSDAARARVFQSLGKFDPKLEASFSKKEFGNKDYYNNWGNELKVPLWLAGADLKVTYDRNTGDYTNPQYSTIDDGLSGVGLTIPIGQGLIIDERRNTLRQARIMVRYAEAEQIKQIITVWYDAVTQYWNWYYAYSQYILLKDGVKLAQTRYEAVSRQAVLGDKAAIDSVEAHITVQDREIQLAKYEVELNNAQLLLSNYLWSDDEKPLELPANAVPETVDENELLPQKVMIDTLVNYAADQHPELLKLRTKGEQLNLENLYMRELLKPRLNISGMLITSRNTFADYYPKYYDVNWRNYKIGLDFSLPLFLRSERGKLKEVRIKQKDNEYEQQQTAREIENKILASYNALTAYKQQLGIQTASILNQQALLNAEQQKFELGESTLFLINSRETKLIDMKMKKAEMITSYQKKMAELYYKAGTRQNAGQ
ncbi:TolC family protein [Foetidibacter luteolus]|uniref:TolC family protein n=1 Tax=Foetidibacter luteolus TaxID=2608880 RepID=UPI00129A5ABE|nr:TolC family protein [Foetidibacter luteolus]